MQATPKTDTEIPVDVCEFANFIGADKSDPLLRLVLQSATDAAIRYINQDLIPRDWVGIVPIPSSARLQLSPYIDPPTTFEIPYTALISVESVKGNGDEDLSYVLQADRRPAKITVHGWDFQSEIKIEYKAGMPNIPVSIKSAIMMIAAFIYDHRGGCDADDAVKRSGGANFLKHHRVEVVI
jgi:hypothetical protein